MNTALMMLSPEGVVRKGKEKEFEVPGVEKQEKLFLGRATRKDVDTSKVPGRSRERSEKW